MRRGHHNSGGWRSENPRHFGPRASGTPRFRPPRSYGPPETPRFPPSGHRFRTYQNRASLLDDRRPPDIHERHSYRGSGHQSRPPDHGHRDRKILPLFQQQRHGETDHGMFNTSNKYFDDKHGHAFNVNNMGDVDHRQTSNVPQHSNTYYSRPSSWANPVYDNKPYYSNHRSPQKTPRDQSLGESMLSQEYTGHRPPASDHYSAPPCPNNNNTPYSRSLDDTVDIVRKRLLNRDTQPIPDQSAVDQDMRQNPVENYQNVTQEPPVKKRIQRQKQIKSNCDKMKNKIVHQLFKMDKDKIHKLMDNPSSSSKFEYAISSLITESQNSLYRHQRSIAEKSLCNTGTDFIHNDTIYEDTFMKQMQCILDPQDTILLEDIKPLVLAELSKVLQLDDFERCESTEDSSIYFRNEVSNEIRNEEQYSDLYYSSEEHSTRSSNNPTQYNYGCTQSQEIADLNFDDNPPMFERRPKKQNEDQDRRERRISESQSRKTIDKNNENLFKAKDENLPLFESNAEQLSEDDDPFADLDNQYHVAVDHNFIENYDLISNRSMSPVRRKSNTQIDSSLDINIKKEIDSQLHDMAQSPLKLGSLFNTNNEAMNKINEVTLNIKKEFPTPVKETAMEPCATWPNVTPPSNKTKTNTEVFSPLESMLAKSSSPRNSRKRSIDQKPAHRKEKRKKSSGPENLPQEPHVTKEDKQPIKDDKQPTRDDKQPTKDEKQPTKDEKQPTKDDKQPTKDDKQPAKLSATEKTDPAEKSESEKKRRDSHRKSRDSESKSNVQKKQQKPSNPQHHSTVSPKESSNTSQKSDPKLKLKTIDMFLEQPKKTLSQVHKTTATVLQPTIKCPDENKPKLFTPTSQPSFARKLVRRHVGTQVVKKYKDRDSQTDTKKLCTKHVQTDSITFTKTAPTSKDPFERMKEIDLEIQVLLQEKFKLYNSLESKDSSNTSTMETLGMTVLNVPLEEGQDTERNNEPELSADAIAEDFVNIPVEELEEIAMETVRNNTDSPKINTRDRRIKVVKQNRQTCESPTTRRTNRKLKTPNISLLEQIITDDRPIEDIISLDDLECTPVKSKKRQPRSISKKKNTRKGKMKKPISHKEVYNLKECSVILIRTDTSNFKQNIRAVSPIPEESNTYVNVVEKNASPEQVKIENVDSVVNDVLPVKSNVIEESVVNDLQFDMLDVSEDIVIGDNCESKNDKDESVEKVPICEEVILDNSQSSIEETAPEVGLTECKIFDYSTDENLRRDSLVVSGNADAVLAIECIETDFVAACLDGNVYHFRGDGQLVNTLRGSNHAVTCLTIVKEKFGTTVYTGSLDSRIRYYDLETGLEKGPECNVLSPIQTMDRAWDTVFVGTRTGFVLQFECKNNMLIPVSTVKFSDQSILALRAMKEGPRKVLLVAARSEDVTIKDAQTGLLLRSLSGPKMTVYTLLFEDGKVYCGTSSHQIHVFDYATGGHVGSHEGGKGAVCLRATGGLVFAGCYDGCVYVYREGETQPLAQLRGPSLMLLSLAIVGSKIIAGYKDRSLYIWKIPVTILQEMIL